MTHSYSIENSLNGGNGMGIVLSTSAAIKGGVGAFKLVSGLIGRGKAQRKAYESNTSQMRSLISQIDGEMSKMRNAKNSLLTEIRKFPNGQSYIRSKGLGLCILGCKKKKAKAENSAVLKTLQSKEQEAIKLNSEIVNLQSALQYLEQEAAKKAAQEAAQRAAQQAAQQQALILKQAQEKEAGNNKIIVTTILLLAAGGAYMKFKKQPKPSKTNTQ